MNLENVSNVELWGGDWQGAWAFFKKVRPALTTVEVKGSLSRETFAENSTEPAMGMLLS